ncbi:hypothetical protein DSO57_1031838 [Entomophthora muscae]|uniref:Uncharacterized protein n=1 Tax=Entomophthora muscae TaxID=34485 RepID=A0ACC2TMJ8_9FUNG|nr:hypothetical protein DSO57_1031838 [Entomophthora muscae]
MEKYIKEHLNLTDEEYNNNDESYYLFYMNDMDKDQFLDGHEIRASYHATQVANHNDEDGDNEVWDLEHLNNWVDQVLKDDDINGDGLISALEYLASQAYHRESS